MLKRLLWLSLFCVLFFLLLGLMVQQDGSVIPPPQKVQTHFALMPQPAPQAKAELNNAVDSLAFNHEEQNPSIGCTVEPLKPLAAKPFHELTYHAFHLSDEAG